MLLSHRLAIADATNGDDRHEEQVAATAAVSGRSVNMAYLVSRYPAVSHTFILREATRLRDLGFRIDVASINAPDRDADDMTGNERAEMREVYYIKHHGAAGALAGHLWGLRRPRRYLLGLWRALRLGGLEPKRIAYGFFYFTEALMVGRWMQQRGLSHLHVHFATAAANVGLALKQFWPVTLSLTVHGPDEFYDAPGQLLREKIAAADFIVCIGHYARSQLMLLSPAAHWSKFEIAPTGVDPRSYALARRQSDDDVFRILCVGRLTPAKGQRVLIEACRKLRSMGIEVRLTLVGDGPDAAELRCLAADLGVADEVEFTGALNQDEVREHYARADAFVLASFAEGVPVSLMEAMASGLPCVSTRITGIPELIRDGVDGLLVPPSDSAALARALGRLQDDQGLRRLLVRNGRDRVRQKYNLGRNIVRLANIFSRRLGASS